MPTLKQEVSLFPDGLLHANWQQVEEDRKWWVIHTYPRQEKVLARQLLRHEVPFYLPLYELKTRRQRRLVRSFLPLFPGYVFIEANDTERSLVFHTNLVVNCLNVRDQERLICDLRRVHGLCESGELITPERKLQVGSPAEIISGPLRGYRGIIVRKGSATRFVIEVDFLQCGASVEVDVSQVRSLAL